MLISIKNNRIYNDFKSVQYVYDAVSDIRNPFGIRLILVMSNSHESLMNELLFYFLSIRVML